MTLTCQTGIDNDSCLTPKQVTAVENIWAGVTNSAGELIYPGLVPGGEAAPGGWGTWVTGAEPYSSFHWRGGEGFFRWFVFDDKDWDFRNFDYDRDLEYALEKVGPAIDADSPDLRALRDNGGKLIVYHGWSDPDISPVASINYFEAVVDFTADDMRAPNYETALNSTQNFFPSIYGARYGSLQWRPRARPFRCALLHLRIGWKTALPLNQLQRQKQSKGK